MKSEFRAKELRAVINSVLKYLLGIVFPLPIFFLPALKGFLVYFLVLVVVDSV